MTQEKKPRKEPFGRPTKYDPSYCQDIIEWFDVEPYRELVDQNGKVYLMPNKFPTLAGWCGKMRINRSTLHEWIGKYEDFSDAYKMCKEMQEEKLIQGGMAGAYATAFSVFAAKNVIGWRDKQLDEVVQEQKPIEIRIVRAAKNGD